MKNSTHGGATLRNTGSRREIVAVVALGLLVGIALGWWGARLLSGPGESRTAHPFPRAAGDGVSSDRTEGEDRLYELWLEYLAAAGRRVVPEEVLDYLDVPLLDARGRVTAEAEELFLLTERERERLNDLLAEVDERLLLTELEHLEILGMTDDEAIFLVAPFDEGSRIEDFLYRGILDVLGQADGEGFWRMLGRSGMERWREFGAVEREIVFSVRDRSPVATESADPEATGVWLHYEERIPPEYAGLTRDEPWRVDVGRTEFFEKEEERDPEREPFFLPDEERYGYVVPYLPERLRRYFLGE